MKKITLLFFFIFSFTFTPIAFASTSNSINNNRYYSNYGKQFTFVERGVTFSVFQNGEFDFYINPKNGARTNVNFGAVSISFNSGYNYDAYVQYDAYGAIIQIEGVPVYYDYYGRVNQIGNIKINYYSNRLARIGNLHVYYNTYGHYSYYTGYINYVNRAYVFHPFHEFFVRPIFNRCVVSYNPYRQYYKPYRYDYHYGSNNHNNYYKKHKKNKFFRKIDARVRTTDSDRNSNHQKKYANRSTRVVQNNASVRSHNSKRNNTSNRNTKSNNSVINQTTKHNVKSYRNRISSTNNRIVQNTGREKISKVQRRNTNYRTTPSKNIKRYKSNQQTSGRSINPQKRKTSSKSVSYRTSSRTDNYKPSKNRSSIKKSIKSTGSKRSNSRRKNS